MKIGNELFISIFFWNKFWRIPYGGGTGGTCCARHFRGSVGAAKLGTGFSRLIGRRRRLCAYKLFKTKSSHAHDWGVREVERFIIFSVGSLCVFCRAEFRQYIGLSRVGKNTLPKKKRREKNIFSFYSHLLRIKKKQFIRNRTFEHCIFTGCIIFFSRFDLEVVFSVKIQVGKTKNKIEHLVFLVQIK